MRKRLTRFLAILLILLTFMSLLPAAAMAANGQDKIDPSIRKITLQLRSGLESAIQDNGTKTKTVRRGQKVTLKAPEDQGSVYSPIEYQWFYRKKGSSRWIEITNAKKYKYTFKAAKAINGYSYRCKYWPKQLPWLFKYTKTVILKVKKR